MNVLAESIYLQGVNHLGSKIQIMGKLCISYIVEYCEKNFCLTKVQTRFSCYKKPELKRPANVLVAAQNCNDCCLFAIFQCYVTNCK